MYADFSFLLNTRGAVDNKAYKEILAGLGIRLKCVCEKIRELIPSLVGYPNW